MLKKFFYLSLSSLTAISFAKAPVSPAETKPQASAVVSEPSQKIKSSSSTAKKGAPTKSSQAKKAKPLVKSPVRATGKQLEVGKQAPTLKEDKSQLVYVAPKNPWTHSDLEQGKKVSVLFYAAPSAKDLNRHVSDAITAANMSRTYYDSYAVVNMKASSWPNFIIAMKLKKSQKEFPYTKYVRDNKKVLVSEWGLQDKSNVIALFDTDGTVLFRYDGKLPEKEKLKLVSLMKERVSALEKKAKTEEEAKKLAKPSQQKARA